MNRRYLGAALLLAMAVIIVWVAGCTRPQSSGPIPKPQAVTPGATVSTPEAIPTSVVETAAAGATATVQSATPTAPPPTPTNTPQPAVTVAPSGQTSYTVKPGDRLFSIGREFNINPYSIARANRLVPPYTIYPGQVLIISVGGATPSPAPGTHTVVWGETVYSIARKYGKSAAAIINANNLGNPNLILPGQVLNIP